MMMTRLALAVLMTVSGADQDGRGSGAAARAVEPQISAAEVIAVYPHDEDAFTQGLFFADGRLYESTGLVGRSSLRQVNIRTGAAVKSRPLPADVFGEGSTVVGDRIVSLTWRAGKGFVHDLSSLETVREFPIEGEGWGLTYDGRRLIMSDGTARLRFLDPASFEETGGLDVTLAGRSLDNLNELEWVEGEIFANIWMTDWIARIDPETGAVSGLIDVGALNPAAGRRAAGDRVANGIAYEPTSKRLFVTGKNWPSLYEIKTPSAAPPEN